MSDLKVTFKPFIPSFIVSDNDFIQHNHVFFPQVLFSLFCRGWLHRLLQVQDFIKEKDVRQKGAHMERSVEIVDKLG